VGIIESGRVDATDSTLNPLIFGTGPSESFLNDFANKP